MCHEHFQLDFGPHVNFISGQNGSGKVRQWRVGAILQAIAGPRAQALPHRLAAARLLNAALRPGQGAHAENLRRALGAGHF